MYMNVSLQFAITIYICLILNPPPPPPPPLPVEQERDLLQPRPYWKEFRFDLTPLPQGETVTAAEFRIYKTLTMGQRANRTLHISVYEIQRDNRHRWGPFSRGCVALGGVEFRARVSS